MSGLLYGNKQLAYVLTHDYDLMVYNTQMLNRILKKLGLIEMTEKGWGYTEKGAVFKGRENWKRADLWKRDVAPYIAENCTEEILKSSKRPDPDRVRYNVIRISLDWDTKKRMKDVGMGAEEIKELVLTELRRREEEI